MVQRNKKKTNPNIHMEAEKTKPQPKQYWAKE